MVFIEKICDGRFLLLVDLLSNNLFLVTENGQWAWASVLNFLHNF